MSLIFYDLFGKKRCICYIKSFLGLIWCLKSLLNTLNNKYTILIDMWKSNLTCEIKTMCDRPIFPVSSITCRVRCNSVKDETTKTPSITCRISHSASNII